MEPLIIPGITNGYKVDRSVWRGAQPTADAWPLLAAAGCKVVIDLNTPPGAPAYEQYSLIKRAGMEPWLMDWSGVLPPSWAQIVGALRVLDRSVTDGNAPVFIHCQHGSDRTGTLCACWRIHHDCWSLEDAVEEAFGSLGFGGMHEFWMAAAVAEYACSRPK